MKDQYIGDINDFHKYALLRSLARVSPAGVRMCWMLTAPDGRTDGNRITYLDDPVRFRPLDPPLFDALGSLVTGGGRSVRSLQASSILPDARFHPHILTDNREERESYFANLRAVLQPGELVFFDPDNGLEVASVRCGGRNSCKYLYWEELATVLGDGRAVCVYQHFPRRPREAFLAGLLTRLEELAEGYASFAVASPSVAYLLCAPRPLDPLMEAAAEVAARPQARLGIHLLDRQ